jgi:putative salt-induced outer membrane protein YdiY
MKYTKKTMKLTILTMNACVLGLAATAVFGQTAGTAPSATPTNATPWDISASAGLTLTRGNSRTLLAVGKIVADKKWDQGINDLSLDADGTYGESAINGVSQSTANQLHGFAQYNRLFSDRFYGDLRVEGLHDEIAAIDYRVTLSAGAGYYFIKGTNNTLVGEVGPGYLYEKDNVPTDSTSSYAILRLAERYEHKFNPHARLWQSIEVEPQVDKFSNYILNAEIGIETTLTKKLSQQTYLQDSFHSEPAANHLKNDVKLVAALAYKF